MNNAFYPSYTFLYSMPSDFENALLKDAKFLNLKNGLLSPSKNDAFIESAVIQAAFPFDELIVSLNAALPKDSGIKLSVKVFSGGKWSAYFDLLNLSDKGFESFDAQENEFGFVDVDVLKLAKKAEAFVWRAVFSYKVKAPVLNLVSVCVTDASAKKAIFKTQKYASSSLYLEPVSQHMYEKEELRAHVCSPASLTMLINYNGAETSLKETVKSVYDAKAKIYGNWAANTAFAGSNSLISYVTRFNDLEAAAGELSAGRPFAASISFAKNALTGSPLEKTKGHLVCVNGITEDGDFEVNDPAFEKQEKVNTVYKAKEFFDAWIVNKKGTAYKMQPRLPAVMAICVPVADLRLTADSENDNRFETQLLMGERVLVLDYTNGYALCKCLDQGGYLGYVKTEALTLENFSAERKIFKPAVTTIENINGGLSVLYAGSYACEVKTVGNVSKVMLSKGHMAEVAAEALEPVSVYERRMFLKNFAKHYLNVPYLWGGLTFSGIDCSGLTHLAYRLLGIEIPRNAAEQKEAAAPIEAKDLKPGDLIFLSKRGGPVYHVMLYLGNERFSEANKDAARVVESAFKQRIGKFLNEIKNGDTVYGETVNFGSYL